MADSKPKSAKGIPARNNYGDLMKLKQDQLVDYFVQKHEANKAGTHWDYRFGTPQTSLYSFAVPKGVPGPGEKRLAIQQPLHRHSYGGWSGEIPKGQYGGGKVTSEAKGKLQLTHVSNNMLRFSTGDQSFALVKIGAKNWIIVNTTPKLS